MAKLGGRLRNETVKKPNCGSRTEDTVDEPPLGGNLVAKLPQASRNNGDDRHSFLRLSCWLGLVGVGCFGLFTTLNP